MRTFLCTLLVLACLAWPRPAVAAAGEPQIYLHDTACIHAVVYNAAVADADATVQRAVDWWRARAPVAQFNALITSEARSIADLRANDARVFRWYYGGDDGDAWFAAARAANARRQQAAGCATSWTVFFVPTNENSWAGIYGPIAFVATANDIGVDATLAHELGHIYGALDQYREARVACAARSGVLGVETQNSDQPGCLLAQDSIMKNPLTSYLCGLADPAALRQMGAWDSDGDGIVDVRDPTPYPTLYLPLVAH